MRYIKCLIGATSVVIAPVAMAQSLSGQIAVHSSYIDDDGLVFTDEPVVQAGVSVDISDNCSLDAWGSLGFNTKTGGELDLGGSCRFSSGDTKIEVSASRYILRGTSDITALAVTVKHGPVDVGIEKYLWENNPDATRINVGYSIEPIDKFTLRPALIYQSGFGEKNVFGAGISASYALNDKLSLKAMVTTPFKGDRSTQASVGISFKF